jgi:hypothetical protein
VTDPEESARISGDGANQPERLIVELRAMRANLVC